MDTETGVVLLGENTILWAGDVVRRSGRVMDVPVGNALIRPYGQRLRAAPQWLKGPIVCSTRFPIERPAPEIMNRARYRYLCKLASK